MVPVAAVLVASIKLNFLDTVLDLAHRGPNEFPCSASFRKGEEMGFFQHGSTIIVFAPDGFALCDGVREGTGIRMGRPLLRMPTI
jgi:phosphatidylserine decarboxylase